MRRQRLTCILAEAVTTEMSHCKGCYMEANEAKVEMMREIDEIEESRSGTIKIADVRCEALQAFVKYLYTAETCLDQNLACGLLILTEKYQVQHHKHYCQKFLLSKLNWGNTFMPTPSPTTIARRTSWTEHLNMEPEATQPGPFFGGRYFAA